LFSFDGDLSEIRKRKVVHNQVTLLTIHIEEKGFVADNIGVLQLFDINEILLQEDDVFAIHLKGLGGKQLARLFAVTFPHYPVCALSDLIPHCVLVVEDGGY